MLLYNKLMPTSYRASILLYRYSRGIVFWSGMWQIPTRQLRFHITQYSGFDA